MSTTESQQVSWLEVYEWAERMGYLVDGPNAGTPTWCALADDAEEKLAAAVADSVHWALRKDTLQAEQAEASRAIAGAADWSALAGRIQRGRGSAYVPRRLEGVA
jgi:Protein of unknown function (DUF2742)